MSEKKRLSVRDWTEGEWRRDGFDSKLMFCKSSQCLRSLKAPEEEKNRLKIKKQEGSHNYITRATMNISGPVRICKFCTAPLNWFNQNLCLIFLYINTIHMRVLCSMFVLLLDSPIQSSCRNSVTVTHTHLLRFARAEKLKQVISLLCYAQIAATSNQN